MMNTVFTKHYPSPPYDRGEILRYAGVGRETAEMKEVLDECLREAAQAFHFSVCYREFPLTFRSGELNLGFARTESKDLGKALSGCDGVIVFAATVGLAIDRLIARYATLSPAKALFLQAVGAERIESLCNLFAADISAQKKRNGLFLRPRFSPGYGDLPLTLQEDIFATLDCHKHIGLTLNQSLIMSPTKSVTALIGVARQHK